MGVALLALPVLVYAEPKPDANLDTASTGVSRDDIHDDIPDAGEWYRSAYAPLWAETPAKHIEDILGFYAITVETHSAEGGVRRDDRRVWLAEPMAQWQAITPSQGKRQGERC